jgi:hypothetical protein
MWDHPSPRLQRENALSGGTGPWCSHSLQSQHQVTCQPSHSRGVPVVPLWPAWQSLWGWGSLWSRALPPSLPGTSRLPKRWDGRHHDDQDLELLLLLMMKKKPHETLQRVSVVLTSHDDTANDKASPPRSSPSPSDPDP